MGNRVQTRIHHKSRFYRARGVLAARTGRFVVNGLVEARVGTLSGGERSRLLLAREFARLSNLLVLDEPTNDLDLETLDLLQEVIADYDGTVLIVSHDRDFLDRTVTITLGLDGSGKVDVVAGGYADWEKQRTRHAPKAQKPPLPSAGGVGDGSVADSTANKPSPDPSRKREGKSAGHDEGFEPRQPRDRGKLGQRTRGQALHRPGHLGDVRRG